MARRTAWNAAQPAPHSRTTAARRERQQRPAAQSRRRRRSCSVSQSSHGGGSPGPGGRLTLTGRSGASSPCSDDPW